MRGFIEELLEQELTVALGRTRHERTEGEPAGYRNGARKRQLLGSFGSVELSVPRARIAAEGGGMQEWRSATLPRYARMTRQVEALIAGAYLSGTNTRRVKRALAVLFGGAVGKDVVSRTWRKVKTDWDAWAKRDLGGEDIVRLILDGTVVRVRLDRKATNISLLVVLAHAPDALHEEISADYTDMIYAETAKEVQSRRKAFPRKWRLRCPAVATSLEEAGDRLFAFRRLPQASGSRR